MKLLPLTNGLEAMVDDEDFYWLNQWRWHCASTGNKKYVCRSRRNNHLGLSSRAYLHRIVMRVEDKDTFVDHIDGNPLNNQKSNLRFVSHTQNCWNTRRKLGSSKYTGVTRDKTRNLWAVSIMCNGKKTFLGRFSSEEIAARVYDEAAKSNFGEYANLNFKD